LENVLLLHGTKLELLALLPFPIAHPLEEKMRLEELQKDMELFCWLQFIDVLDFLLSEILLEVPPSNNNHHNRIIIANSK